MISDFAKAKGHKLHYVRDGEAGLPIFLVHGVPSASFRWRPVQQLISPYLRTYAYDIIGMGKSDKPREGWDYTFENDAHQMAELMDHWGFEKMVICGDDWGGGIALTFAALYPERTELLIAMNAVCLDIWPVPEIEAVGRAHFIEDDDEFLAAMSDLPAKIAQTLRTMIHKPWKLTALDQREYVEQFQTIDYAKGGSQILGNAGYATLKLDGIRSLAARAASMNTSWTIDLDYTAITAPTMILWGARDIFLDPRARFRLKNEIANAPVRVQLIEEAGHLPGVERPEFVAESILDFVSEHRGLDALAQRYLGGLVEE
ncbi:MAG: alpha/beta hydrolase [Kiloniellales bacterium]